MYRNIGPNDVPIYWQRPQWSIWPRAISRASYKYLIVDEDGLIHRTETDLKKAKEWIRARTTRPAD